MSFFSRHDSTPPAETAVKKQERGRTARLSGYDAESAATAYLQSKGVRILARNVRSKGGEIDIVGSEGETLIFVEVRLRKNTGFGTAADSVTATKQRRIAHAAQYFLLRNPALANRPCRFDCVLMESPGNFDWLRDAFRLS